MVFTEKIGDKIYTGVEPLNSEPVEEPVAYGTVIDTPEKKAAMIERVNAKIKEMHEEARIEAAEEARKRRPVVIFKNSMYIIIISVLVHFWRQWRAQ